MKKETRSLSFEVPVAVLVIATLALAPFIGGKDQLFGTAGLSILALASLGLLLWSRQFVRPISVWPFAAFVGLLAASAVVTASLHATIEQTLYFAACAAAALVASSAMRKDKWFVAALFGFVGAGLMLGAMGVTEYVQQFKINGPGWRVFGTFINPGYLGGYLVLALPVTLAAFLASRSPAAAIGSGLAIGFEMATMLLTGTRFAVIAIAAAFIVFVILALWTQSVGRKQLVRLGIAIAILAAAVILTAAPMLYRVKGKVAAQQAYSGGFRVATWKGTANIVRAHPLLGTGAGTFELVFPRYMVAGYTRNAHNGYLQIAAEAGVPALGAAAAAFGALLLAGLRGLRREEESSGLLLPRGASLLACGVLAALVGSLARNLLDSDIQNPGIGFSFWILAGLVAARAPIRKVITLPTAAKAGLSVLLLAMTVMLCTFVLGRLDADAATGKLLAGDLLSGIDLYQSAASKDPLCGEYWLNLGRLRALTEDQWSEGVDDIRRAIRLEPTRARNVIVLGRILASHGDRRGAIAAFRRALDLDPYCTPAMLAAAQLLTGREADEMYSRMLKVEKSPIEQLRGVPELVNPDYAWAHYYFGQKYLQEGRWQDAEKHFRAAVDRLELRNSHKLYLEAAKVAGMSDPEEEAALTKLLEDSKAGLAEAEARGRVPGAKE